MPCIKAPTIPQIPQVLVDLSSSLSVNIPPLTVGVCCTFTKGFAKTIPIPLPPGTLDFITVPINSAIDALDAVLDGLQLKCPLD